MNKANLELIQPSFGRSFSIKQFSSSNNNDKANFWHFHPELELVYVQGGNGIRHVGNHLSYFNDGDLVFIGSNLPHNGFTDAHTGNRTEVVVQFRADFLGKSFFQCPEFERIQQLFHRALNGLTFYGNTKESIGQRLEHLAKKSPFESVIELIQILQLLAKSKECQILNAQEYSMSYTKQDNDRAAFIFQYVRDHYKSNISLEAISRLSNLTVSSFCRYFKKLTGKTFTTFVNEFRIIESCKLMSQKNLLIRSIAFEVGFNNFAHFSKHFKLVTGKSPSAYRKGLLSTVRM